MFKFSLVTPESKIVEDVELEEVIVPAHRGELNILPGHSPLMTTLETGVLKYKQKGSSEFTSACIGWGYLEVGPKGVTVLAETAETAEALDKQRAEVAYKKAKEALESQGSALSQDEITRMRRKMQKAEARIKLVSE